MTDVKRVLYFQLVIDLAQMRKKSFSRSATFSSAKALKFRYVKDLQYSEENASRELNIVYSIVFDTFSLLNQLSPSLDDILECWTELLKQL